MGIDVTSVLGLAAEFEAVPTAAAQRVTSTMNHWAHMARDAIAARAPGEHYPGTIKVGPPEIIRGHLRQEIGTDDPTGWRKERGFHGRDSLGRTYDQAGHPHFVPGLDAIEAPFLEALAQAIVPPEAR